MSNQSSHMEVPASRLGPTSRSSVGLAGLWPNDSPAAGSVTWCARLQPGTVALPCLPSGGCATRDTKVSASRRVLGECYELHVHCKTSFVGYFPATVLWELLGPGEPGSEGAGTFYIARFLAAVAHSPLAAQLKPTTPFKRTQVSRNPVVTRRIEEGERPDR